MKRTYFQIKNITYFLSLQSLSQVHKKSHHVIFILAEVRDTLKLKYKQKVTKRRTDQFPNLFTHETKDIDAKHILEFITVYA